MAIIEGKMKMWVLLIGNPIEGFTITGPFGSPADATYYGDHHMDQNIEWWVMEVNAAIWAEEEQKKEQEQSPIGWDKAETSTEDTKPRPLPLINKNK
jgi:hypothetical protein